MNICIIYPQIDYGINYELKYTNRMIIFKDVKNDVTKLFDEYILKHKKYRAIILITYGAGNVPISKELIDAIELYLSSISL